jgi:hypothetical protein
VLVVFGFEPTRVELALDGSVVLHTTPPEQRPEADPLAQWEASRARQIN